MAKPSIKFLQWALVTMEPIDTRVHGRLEGGWSNEWALLRWKPLPTMQQRAVDEKDSAFLLHQIIADRDRIPRRQLSIRKNLKWQRHRPVLHELSHVEHDGAVHARPTELSSGQYLDGLLSAAPIPVVGAHFEFTLPASLLSLHVRTSQVLKSFSESARRPT